MGRKSVQEQRRAEVLDHYARAIIEDGLEGASTGNVARRMGIGTSLLMHYFPSKEAMVRAMIARIVDAYGGMLIELLDHVTDPLARLRLIVNRLVGTGEQDPELQRLFYSCYPLVFRDEKIRGMFQEMFVQFRLFLESELESAMEAGKIPRQSAPDLAAMIVTVVEGKDLFHPLLADQEDLQKQQKLLVNWVWELITAGNTSSLASTKN